MAALTDRAAQIDRKRAELLAACRDRGIPVTGDGFVSEPHAAGLLGLAPGTLRNWRGMHRPLAYRRTAGKGHGRVWYALLTVAAYLVEAGRAAEVES